MKSLKFLTAIFIFAEVFSISELKAVKVICEDIKDNISEQFLSHHVSVKRQINIHNDDNSPFDINIVRNVVSLMNNNNININYTTFKFLNFTEERHLEQIRNFILTLAVLPNLRVVFEPSQDVLKDEFLAEQNKILNSMNPSLAHNTRSL